MIIHATKSFTVSFLAFFFDCLISIRLFVICGLTYSRRNISTLTVSKKELAKRLVKIGIFTSGETFNIGIMKQNTIKVT